MKCAGTGNGTWLDVIKDFIRFCLIFKKSSSEILARAKKEGMLTMRQDGFIKAIKGVTTIDEVLRVTSQGGAENEQ